MLQDGIILHDGRKTPSHPDYTDQPLFKVVGVPSYVLPGYAEPLGACRRMRLFLPLASSDWRTSVQHVPA